MEVNNYVVADFYLLLLHNENNLFRYINESDFFGISKILLSSEGNTNITNKSLNFCLLPNFDSHLDLT